jgi:gamma-glutamylcysteine synthetase
MTAPSNPTSRWHDRLAARFTSSFPERVAWRTLGREAELPVVHPDGTAADIACLWPYLAEGHDARWHREADLVVGVDVPGVSWSAEVGFGTMEAVMGVFRDLHEMRDTHEAAMERLMAAADRAGVIVLGYGIQPKTPATPHLMTAKRRYRVLLDVLGETWLWFTLTASDQTHVAVDRHEAVGAADLTNLLAPVSVALLANSPVFAGAQSGFVSAREATMGRIHAASFRHGMPAGPCRDGRGWVGRTMPLDYLMHRDGDVITPVGRPFGAWLDEQAFDEDAAFAAWVWHDHYVWNSARPRTAHGTVELRSPCQQPWSEHMAAAALGAGMVCAWRELQAFLDAELGDAAWPTLRRWHADVVREGLAAEEPVPGLIAGVLRRVEDGLAARGLGEERYVAPLWRRLEARVNPGQAALEAFRAGGIPGLIDHARVG